MSEMPPLRPDPDAPQPPVAPRRVLGRFGQFLVFAFLVFLVLVASGFALFFALTRPLVVTSHSETVDERFIGATKGIQEVALLSLQVQGIESKRSATTWTFPWGSWDVPGSERALFVQYSFTAKLGIDGEAVTIEPRGDEAFTVTIPPFVFIGQDQVRLELAVEDNGVLSWLTPEFDQIALANEILSDPNQATYVEQNRETLEGQARDFYTQIARSIDPDIELEFRFAG